MSKEEIEKIFKEEQFNDLLDILLDNKVIDAKTYNYYMELYYTEKDYKEDFIENVIDRS